MLGEKLSQVLTAKKPIMVGIAPNLGRSGSCRGEHGGGRTQREREVLCF